MKLKAIALIAIAFACTATAFAAPPTLKFATGKADKAFSKLYGNINKYCAEEVATEELNTTGGFENVGVLTDKVASLAFVPIDVYQAMAGTDDAVGMLRGVMSLNSNMLHIVVKKSGYAYDYLDQNDKYCDGKEIFGKCTGDWKPKKKSATKVITTVEDLKGLKVAAVGSAQVLARSYFNKKLSYNLDIENIELDKDALDKLEKGQVKAVLTTLAYSNTSFVSLMKPERGLTLVDFNLQPSAPYKIMKKNYKNLGIFGRQFLTVSNILMARPLDPASEAGIQVTKLKACINTKLDRLKTDDGTEPSWSDVTSTALPEGIPSWSGVLPGKKK
jgi:TRAP-type uncharacterized transport system substrate-binding protein